MPFLAALGGTAGGTTAATTTAMGAEAASSAAPALASTGLAAGSTPGIAAGATSTTGGGFLSGLNSISKGLEPVVKIKGQLQNLSSGAGTGGKFMSPLPQRPQVAPYRPVFGNGEPIGEGK